MLEGTFLSISCSLTVWLVKYIKIIVLWFFSKLGAKLGEGERGQGPPPHPNKNKKKNSYIIYL